MRFQRSASPSDPGDTMQGYLRYSRMKVLFIAGCVALLVFLSLFTLGLGDTDLSYSEILRYLFFPDGSWNSTAVWELRFRMVAAAILAGAALGIAGTVMQSILRNPLASPFTLGLSNAAAFGAAVAILAGNGSSIMGSASAFVDGSNPFVITLCAFAFAMLATGVMLLLVRVTGCTPETIVLAGTALSSIFSAGLAFLQYTADDNSLSAIVYWQFGTLSKCSFEQLAIILAVLVPVSLYFLHKRWDYNAMEAGEDVARGLGVNVRLTRYLGLTLAAVLTAIVVSFMGVIGFIGLVGPHMVKRLVGNDNRYVLPGSMAVGALVLLLAYIVGTFGFGEEVIPVGIITSAVGGPLFIWILIRGRVRR